MARLTRGGDRPLHPALALSAPRGWRPEYPWGGTVVEINGREVTR